MKMFKNMPKSRLLKQIARLNLISGTPETAFKIDPTKYSKIELLLAESRGDGKSVGLRKFWKHNLPTLKFHNDDIDFVVTRVAAETKDEEALVPVKLLVYGTAETKTFNVASEHSDNILEQLVKYTNAKSIPEEELPTIKVQTPEW